MLEIDHAREWGAAWLHREVGSDPEDPWRADAVAEALFGPGCIQSLNGRAGEGCLSRERGKWIIRVGHRHNWRRRHFAIAHEIAEWWYRDKHLEFTELACDQMAASIIAPRRATMKLFNAVGLDVAEFAETFEVTETCAALRFGEVVFTPVAMISPQLVRVRGWEWGWPDEDQLRRMLREERLPDGVHRLPIRDERGRVALIADAAA